MPGTQDVPVILHNDKRGLLVVEDGQLEVLQLEADGSPPKRLLCSPTRLLLRARLAPADQDNVGNRRLDLHVLHQKGSASHLLRISKIHVLVEPTHATDAEEWVETLMSAAYPVTKPYRKVLLFVNPVGGKGKARSIVKDTVVPILDAAGCLIELVETTHRYHAEEVVKAMELKYDVIATASGDGLVFEVLNGLAERPDAKRALRTPIAPIPTGSANACCTNLFGVEDTFNVELATLNIIKGQNLPVDLCSVLLMPSGKRRVSFLSQALGLMVDADIGTENLRWMGDSRFMYGFIRGVAQNKICKARLKLDIVTDDKDSMAATARAAAREAMGGNRAVGGGTDPLELIRGVQKMSVSPTTPVFAESEAVAVANGDSGKEPQTKDGDEDGPLPPALPLKPDDTWLTIDSQAGRKPTPDAQPGPGGWVDGNGMLYLYAGLMPWVSRDLNQWPVVQAGAGVIDLVVQRVVPRGTLLKAIAGSEKGETFWEESQHYYKVRAFTAENLETNKECSVTLDGEGYRFESFHVEVLPRAATLCSLDGRFYLSEFVTTSKSGPKVGASAASKANRRRSLFG